jgi:hypothetical protein
MVHHALKVTIGVRAVRPLNAQGYAGIERMLEGPREETNKEFRIFSDAWEVHTWPEAWIGFCDLRKTRTRKRECKTFFRNPNANLPNVTGRPPHETIYSSLVRSHEEIAQI